MKRILVALGVLAASMVAATPAKAAITIDFGTGVAGTGGSVQILADGSILGTNIPVAQLNVDINGTLSSYFVSGTATGSGTAGIVVSGANFGSLNFYTGGQNGASSISISGCVPSLNVGTDTASYATVPFDPNCTGPVTLLSGTISTFDASKASQGLVSASGADTKGAALLTALGLPSNLQWAFFGFSVVSGSLATGGSSSAAISTDIKNTAVPEPASMLLLGTGLAGIAGAARRRLKKTA